MRQSNVTQLVKRSIQEVDKSFKKSNKINKQKSSNIQNDKQNSTRSSISKSKLKSISIIPDKNLIPAQKISLNKQLNQQKKKYSIHYRNGIFQGKICLLNKIDKKKEVNQQFHQQQTINRQNIIKQGYGIIMDDNMNIIVSNWKDNTPSSNTVFINRLNHYLYGNFINYQNKLQTPKHQPQHISLRIRQNGPSQTILCKIQKYYLLTSYSNCTGNLQMATNHNSVMIVIDQDRLSVLVVKGKVQETLNSIRPSKNIPLTVVQFSQFSQKNLRRSRLSNRPLNGIKQIIEFYLKKYNLSLKSNELHLSEYLQSIALSDQNKNKPNLQQKLDSLIVLTMTGLKKSSISQNKTKSTENDKQQQISPQLIIYKQITKDSIKLTQGVKTKRVFYFGYQNGLGIKFTNGTHIQLYKNQKLSKSQFNHNINQNQSNYKFKIKSMGLHDNQNKLSIGLRYFQNNCIEEGNFKSKQTFTYENPAFRTQNKLNAIYNKYHKKSIFYVNQYLELKQISILSKFEQFIHQHIQYIFQQCISETTKVSNIQDKNSLIVQMLLSKKHDINSTSKLNQLKFLMNNNVQLSTNNKKSRTPTKKISEKQTKTSKTKDKIKSSQKLNSLKQKNNQFKNKITKVKYQIQYQKSNEIGQSRLSTKLNKYLHNNIQNYKGKSQKKQDKSQNKSSKNIKQGKNYIKKQKLNKSFDNSSPNQSPMNKTKQLANQSPLNKMKQLKKSKRKNQQMNKYQSSLKESPKQLESKLYNQINKVIQFKQQYNEGISFNINNSNLIPFIQQPIKNKLSDRQSIYTTQEIDKVLQTSKKYLKQGLNYTPRSISKTRDIKQRKNQRYRHYIYSNQNDITKNEKPDKSYLKQRQIEDSIRAQLLGLTLDQYRQKIILQTQKQQFVQKKLFSQDNKQLSYYYHNNRFAQQKDNAFQYYNDHNKDHRIHHQNNNFNKYQRDNSSSPQNQIQNLYTNRNVKKMHQVQNNNQKQMYKKPIMQQESLVQRRLRIIQEFKQLNEKSPQKINQKSQSQINQKGQQKTNEKIQQKNNNKNQQKDKLYSVSNILEDKRTITKRLQNDEQNASFISKNGNNQKYKKMKQIYSQTPQQQKLKKKDENKLFEHKNQYKQMNMTQIPRRYQYYFDC